MSRFLMVALPQQRDECNRYLAEDAPVAKTYVVIVFLIASVANLRATVGQHCPPIVESYLESIAVKHVKNGISFNIDYRKSGGQTKESYQAYIVAYSHSDTERLLGMSPQKAIESKAASIVHTQLASRKENGCYGIECELKTKDLVAALLKEGRLDHKEIDDFRGWKSFKGLIRFAVFVPFLEDEKLSIIKGLPEKKHECNYLEEDGLIFEMLPHTMSVHFGIVQAVSIPDGEYYIQINGNRTSEKTRKDAK